LVVASAAGTLPLAVQAESAASQSSLRALVLHRLAPLVIALAALLVLLNGTLFSSWGAPTVDFAINYSAALALRDGVDPYGKATLYEYGVRAGSRTDLIYSQLFTSYIQPPTSALSILPLSFLPWQAAKHVYLVLNHVMLFATVAITLITLRPAMSTPWLAAWASVILAFFSQLNASFSLGQVDATLLLLFSIGFWAFTRGRSGIAGSAIAIAAAIKLVPALLLLYFLWKRDHRAFAWGAGVGIGLFVVSLVAVGPDVYQTYVGDTLPALAKGSTHYSNASFGALIARLSTPDVINGLPAVFYLDEVPSGVPARLAAIAVVLGGLAFLALVIPRGGQDSAEGVWPSGYAGRLILEYYLVIAVIIMVNGVAWEFYTVWLIPVFLAAFLAPDHVLPWGRLRRASLLMLALIYVGLNYPGDLFIFDGNGFLYHPDWVTGVWVEDRVRLYHNHFDAILILRLGSLLLFTATLAAVVLYRHPAPWMRRRINRGS
jgi:hypothetical protein